MITSDRAGLVQVMLIMAWLVLDRELRIDPIERTSLKNCSAHVRTTVGLQSKCVSRAYLRWRRLGGIRAASFKKTVGQASIQQGARMTAGVGQSVHCVPFCNYST